MWTLHYFKQNSSDVGLIEACDVTIVCFRTKAAAEKKLVSVIIDFLGQDCIGHWMDDYNEFKDSTGDADYDDDQLDRGNLFEQDENGQWRTQKLATLSSLEGFMQYLRSENELEEHLEYDIVERAIVTVD